MKIKILGTRGKIEPKAENYSNHSGILIDDELLIDVGEAEFLKYSPKAILFTHFHPDHAYFVAAQEKFTSEIPLFGPETHELLPELQVITGEFKWKDYSITPIPVIHALRLKSLGYIIQKGQKRVFLTGDVAWIEKAALAEVAKLDLIITEATSIHKGGRINRKKDRIFGHTGAPDLIRLLSPLTPKIVFCHYGQWFFENTPEVSVKKLINLSSEVEILPAFDGMEIEI